MHWIFLGKRHFAVSPIYNVMNIWKHRTFEKIFLYLGFVFQAASPACTELETVMLDWLGKMLNLPEDFIAGTEGQGGGVIQVNVFCVFYASLQTFSQAVQGVNLRFIIYPGLRQAKSKA